MTLVKGISVVVANNGKGIPVTPVAGGAPKATVSGNGLGLPIVISDNAVPLVIDGLVDFEWETITLTAGDGDQWVGFSDGGPTRPQPGFGSISGEPSTKTELLALYDDTASNVYLAVFKGEWLGYMESLPMSIGGFPFSPFDANVIDGNTWVRYYGSGDWLIGQDYQVEFG